MKKTNITKQQKRERRRRRVRAQVIGTATKPRLNVFRSLRGMYVQLIDDAAGKTLAAAHSKTLGPVTDAGDRKGREAVAYGLGKLIAEKAKALNITETVFDRAGYRYHGRVKAVAEGARDGGLKF